MAKLLSWSRYTIVLGVIASVVLSVAIIIASVVRTAIGVIEAATKITDPKTAKQIAVVGIEIADLLLIATVLYIIAVGLYELFIGDVDVPSWISVTSLNDLKNKLLNIVVAVLAVTFLIQVVNWDGTTNLLPLGAAIAAVVLAVTAFGLLNRGAKSTGNSPTSVEDESDY